MSAAGGWRWLAVASLLGAQCCCALDAKWTPAADGGPARFSKRYRQAHGIDDSRWGGDDSSVRYIGDTFAQILPDSPLGWMLAALAGLMCLALLHYQKEGAISSGSGRTTASPSDQHIRTPAAEAAREAALKRHAS
ncbi:hypothetical protein AB1Y20_010578 [Prymnesium parvum]|uniref:Uncharacterized protein n=1 Tax=Prymnesium parvum TaxID=97485 RepID=A0AB34IR69_PRYPA